MQRTGSHCLFRLFHLRVIGNKTSKKFKRAALNMVISEGCLRGAQSAHCNNHCRTYLIPN